ncbi:MAG: hypothetical protein ACYS7Y_30685 [Planctomycetota bacterium]
MKSIKPFLMLWLTVVIMTIALTQCEGATSIIEIPLKMERIYVQRTPGQTDFVLVGWTQQGKAFAIPEQRMAEFIQLAAELDLTHLQRPGGVVGNIAILKIEVEHTSQIAWFWDDDGTIFAAWNDDPVPAQVAMNGVEVTDFFVSPFPKAPTNPEIHD